MIKETAAPRSETFGISRYTAALAPYTLTFLRVLVGITFLLHGLPKLQGLSRFSGFVGSLGMPLPGFVAVVIVALEVLGGILLIVGLATRWVSLLFALEMIVTTLLVKLPTAGFIAQQGAGAELDLLLLAAALVLLTHGAGPLSVEKNILRRDL